MASDDHELPSASTALTHFTTFYDKATLNKDGSVTVVLKVPAENRDATIALGLPENAGKALNVTVWETVLPPGMEELARAVGLVEKK